MPEPYDWTCGCGHTGRGEAAAQRHVKDDGCRLMGYPKGYHQRERTTPQEDPCTPRTPPTRPA